MVDRRPPKPPHVDQNIMLVTRPTIPTMNRIIPTVCRLIPEVDAVTAHLRIAPAAISKILTDIPMVLPLIRRWFQSPGSPRVRLHYPTCVCPNLLFGNSIRDGAKFSISVQEWATSEYFYEGRSALMFSCAERRAASWSTITARKSSGISCVATFS
jgi:hypothetical protein